jgi:hypothetical protein
MNGLISAVAWVRQGVAIQHPQKYVLDDQELERVSALARIELEDARVELERAHEAAKTMGLGAEGEEADDQGADDDEENWVECASRNVMCPSIIDLIIVKMTKLWTSIRHLSLRTTTFLSTS